MILLRCWRLLTPASAAWLAASLAAAGGDAAWRRFAPRSYVARREVPAAVLRVAAYSLPTTWALLTAMLNQHGELPSGMHWAAQAAVYACLLAFASGAAKVRAGVPGPEGRHSRSLLTFSCGAAPHATPFAQMSLQMAANALSLRCRLRQVSDRRLQLGVP